MNILALDTATHTGWAVSTIGSVIESGVEDFSIRTRPTKTEPEDHPGLRFAGNWSNVRTHPPVAQCIATRAGQAVCGCAAP